MKEKDENGTIIHPVKYIQKNSKNSDQYYQVSSARLGNSAQNDGTLHLKSGDIVGLEKSFAQFLKAIYQQTK